LRTGSEIGGEYAPPPSLPIGDAGEDRTRGSK
jgi:hypothetical protein